MKPRLHESAEGHVSGRAIYTDEQHPPQGLLSLWPVQAPHAHAQILAHRHADRIGHARRRARAHGRRRAR